MDGKLNNHEIAGRSLYLKGVIAFNMWRAETDPTLLNRILRKYLGKKHAKLCNDNRKFRVVAGVASIAYRNTNTYYGTPSKTSEKKWCECLLCRFLVAYEWNK